jgi:glycosyltransferase involved in cell wall biosynthesis
MTAVIIPAHNEAKTLGAVLAAAMAPSVRQVIVVADACDDGTEDVASSSGAELVVIDAGDKGTAMAVGVSRASESETLFLDADVRGLSVVHVEALCQAEPAGGMVVGLTDDASPAGLPPVTGERRLPTSFVRALSLAGTGYRAELVIDAAAARSGLPHTHYRLVGVHNPRRPWRHPLMLADLALYALVHAPALALYTEQSLVKNPS